MPSELIRRSSLKTAPTALQSLAQANGGVFKAGGSLYGDTDTSIVWVNSWIQDTSGNGFVAQANALVAGNANAVWADFVDPCLGTEANAAGGLTPNRGFWQGAQSGILASGAATAATATTTTSVTDSAAAFAFSGLKDYVVHISGGTGSGQVRSIAYNKATVISVGLAFTSAPDATSTYRVYDGNTIDRLHETTGGHTREATAVTAKIATLMTRT
jgi:hypothetical protein